MARGHSLTIAPESDLQRMTIVNENGNELQLLDGRGRHNNGWFVVRSLVAKGATKNAISWLVTPHAIAGWRSDPVVQVSQVGYHPLQEKIAVIELDKHDRTEKKPAWFASEPMVNSKPFCKAVRRTGEIFCGIIICSLILRQ